MTTLRQMTDEVRDLNTEKGWRERRNTWGDYVGLLNTEVGEQMDAYRRWGYNDATATGCVRCTTSGVGACDDAPHVFKPEGIGAEAADILIRFLDMCDAYGMKPFDMDMELADVDPLEPPYGAPTTFGGWNAWLVALEGPLYPTTGDAPASGVRYHLPLFLRALVKVCEVHGIDLTAEYERKMTHNRTRPYLHGGRLL